jgi:AraC-like DNA-binding protein
MDGEGLQVACDHHPPGEYSHSPGRLIISLALGSPLTLEQVSDGRMWFGRSARGAINVLPPGLPRVFRHREACHFAYVTMPCARDLRPLVAARDEPLRLILESLVAAAEDGDASRLFRDAIASAIVARLEELAGRRLDAPRRGLGRTAYTRVLEYLRAHLAEEISVERLARVAGLSPSHFSTLFHASFGESPHRHLLRLRVERARELLEKGADPAAAALAVGFCDQSHLGRHMRRMLGITPGAIARACRSPKETSAAIRTEHRTNVRDGRRPAP